MKRLLTFLPVRRALWITAAVVVLGPFLLLGAFLLIALAFRADVEVDAAKVLLALAACIVAAAAYHVVRYLQRPKQTVTVCHDLQLIEPLLPIGRTTFKLEIYYEVEERGERLTVRQGVVELKFHKRDNPDLIAWCGEQLQGHRRRAAQHYPEARIVDGGAPAVPRLTAES